MWYITCVLPDDGSPDKAVLDREHVRVLLRIGDRDVGELDVEVLVDRVEGAADGEVVLQLDHDVLADQGLEERVEEHNEGHEGRKEGLGKTLKRVASRRPKVYVLGFAGGLKNNLKIHDYG